MVPKNKTYYYLALNHNITDIVTKHEQLLFDITIARAAMTLLLALKCQIYMSHQATRLVSPRTLLGARTIDKSYRYCTNSGIYWSIKMALHLHHVHWALLSLKDALVARMFFSAK